MLLRLVCCMALPCVLLPAGVTDARAHSGAACLRELESAVKQRPPGPNHRYVVECWDNGMTCTAGVVQTTSAPPVAPIADLRASLERCFVSKMPKRMAHPKMPQDTIFMNEKVTPPEGCTLTPIELKNIAPPQPFAWAFLAVCHGAP